MLLALACCSSAASVAMSVKLRELIRSVRACKTAADERAVIAKECALIRTSFKAAGQTERERRCSAGAELLLQRLLHSAFGHSGSSMAPLCAPGCTVLICGRYALFVRRCQTIPSAIGMWRSCSTCTCSDIRRTSDRWRFDKQSKRQMQSDTATQLETTKFSPLCVSVHPLLCAALPFLVSVCSV